jgi:flagellar hook-basal body complex protein FliE
MIDGINGSLVRGPLDTGRASVGAADASQGPGASSFADVLKNSIDEVVRLQQKSGQGVRDLVAGRTDDIAQVMTESEKAGLAFKMLLAIRAKLMDAYQEIKNMQV